MKLGKKVLIFVGIVCGLIFIVNSAIALFGPKDDEAEAGVFAPAAIVAEI